MGKREAPAEKIGAPPPSASRSVLGDGALPEDLPESAAAAETRAAPVGVAPSGAIGLFRLYYLPPKDQANSLYARWASETPRFRTILSNINFVALPRDVPVVFRDCGTANAFYDPKRHAISVCYEYLALFHRLFKDRISGNQTDAQAKDDALNAITFSMLHESGHALIGELKLGVSGGEEDAVDDWATIASVQLIKVPEIALDSAKRFQLLAAKRTTIEKVSFLDEHSIDDQRFGNIYCSIYGSDPKKWSPLVGKVVLKTRAGKCPDEWEKKNRFWAGALVQHLRGKSSGAVARR